ncbi:glycosyl transferase [Paenibacillus sp. SC116]|uniref:macrolide family glycosyltransferase n=1 Tax=Paenibacillus sp. SC116 TaxID=2968986 RepID=UPI00215A7F37|nr:macrolide family glycosyltransferase [Paenibacillus sp. SC116]MCR8842268.1 glycosyl transferase [Paenibacillus sp. SC116]
MARVLYVTIPAEGHVNPTVGLVKQLVDNGEEVVYMNVEPFRHRLAQTGAEFRAYPINEQLFVELGLSPTEFTHPHQLTEFILRGMIEPIIPEVLRLTENDSFDYVIVDSLFGWGGALLGEKLGIPLICSATNFVFDKPVSHVIKMKESDENFDAEALCERLTNTAERVALACNVTVPALDDITRQYGQQKVVFTSRYFQPESEKFDDSYIFTGPSISPRPDDPSFPFDQLRSQYNKVVYISMGSILNKDIEFYKLCFEAFKDIPAQFVLASGRATDITALDDSIPNNFIIQPYVPQLEILQRADAFVTHAGMNSASEALYYDVPLVAIPLSSDQPIVAQQAEHLGAGITLDKDSLTPETLKLAVLKVLNNPIYKQRAKMVGDSFRSAGGYQEAADRIMSLFSKV